MNPVTGRVETSYLEASVGRGLLFLEHVTSSPNLLLGRHGWVCGASGMVGASLVRVGSSLKAE